MSLINVTNIKIGNNVCNIRLPLIFQIEFECLENLKHDVEWKIIYITSDGSGYDDSEPKAGKSENVSSNGLNSDSEPNKSDNSKDEEDYLISNNKGEIILDAVCLGPLYKGVLEFEFRVNPPNFLKLNPSCILGMQAILISGNYCDQEFIRIGYYTNNVYDEESLVENPPDNPILDKIVRCIIDQPRVTRFPIKWDNDDLIDYEGNNLNFIIDTDESDSEHDNQSDNIISDNEQDNIISDNQSDNIISDSEHDNQSDNIISDNEQDNIISDNQSDTIISDNEQDNIISDNEEVVKGEESQDSETSTTNSNT